MGKVTSAKLTIYKDSNGHKLLDDLKIPYRLKGKVITVSMNEEQFSLFNSKVLERSAEWAKIMGIGIK